MLTVPGSVNISVNSAGSLHHLAERRVVHLLVRRLETPHISLPACGGHIAVGEVLAGGGLPAPVGMPQTPMHIKLAAGLQWRSMFALMDQCGLRAWLRLLAVPALAAVIAVRGDGQLRDPHDRVTQLLDSLAALPAYMPLDTLRRAFPFLTCKDVVPHGSAGDHWCVGRTSGLFVSATTREGRLIEIGAQESPPLVLGAWARARHGLPVGTCEHSYRPRSTDDQAGSVIYTWWTRRGWTLILSSHPKFAAIGLTLSGVPLASLHCDPGTLHQTP